MAGVSRKYIKNRIRSLNSTRQITKAMETVANTKLRKAQNGLSGIRPYFQTLGEMMDRILQENRDNTSAFLRERGENRVLYVVIAGDRGLAGGYNHNILKCVTREISGRNGAILPVGRKAYAYFKNSGASLLDGKAAEVEKLSAEDCFALGEELSVRFQAGEFDAVYVAYTVFSSVLAQRPNVLRLLPLSREGCNRERGSCSLYEPEGESILARFVPEDLGGVLYSCLCESRVSEQAARRTAMDTASKNAEELIDGLRLQYNRARQAAITQEIAQILGGK